jgi:hypothetical protein
MVRDRVLPAIAGLDVEQMMAAIASVGYSPYLLRTPTTPADHDAFAICMVTYLRSGIPGVLILDKGSSTSEHHAVVLAGFREDLAAGQDCLNVRGIRHRGVIRLYVHDDNLGPYVRMALKPTHEGRDLQLVRLLPNGQDDPDTSSALLYRALFPLYPKLRLTAPDLMEIAGTALKRMDPYARDGSGDSDLNVDMRFILGGNYLRTLAQNAVPNRTKLLQFLSSASLSRYVGVIRVFKGTEIAADIVCDTTDIARNTPAGAPVLAVLCFHPDYATVLSEFVNKEAPQAVIY